MIAPLAPADVTVAAFKREADELDALYQRHIKVCWAVEAGIWCRACTVLCAAADDAGKRVRLAEERLS